MLKLVLNRFGLGILTLFAASVLIFIGTEILPGDLASAILQNTATPETLAKDGNQPSSTATYLMRR